MYLNNGFFSQKIFIQARAKHKRELQIMKREKSFIVFLLTTFLISNFLTIQVLGLKNNYGITSFGAISYISGGVVEYGFSIGGPHSPSYNNPYYKTQNWQNRIVESGAKWVRFDLYGVFDDDLVNYWKEEISTLRVLGMKILTIFSYELMPSSMYETFSLEDWRTYVRMAITKFAGFIDAVEVWNEPDMPEFVHGYMDSSPEHYFDILKVVYEEVKAVDPNVIIVAGSVATLREGGGPPPDSDGDFWGGTLIKEIWNLGAENYCDAVSIHTYKFWLNDYVGPEFPDGSVITHKDAVELAYSITNKPIWVTELSATTGNNPITEQYQTDWMENAFNSLEAANPLPVVVIWFYFYSGSENYQSVLHTDFTPKPSFDVFKSFAL